VEKSYSVEDSLKRELLDFIEDDFEKKVLTVAINEPNPEEILKAVKELIREKLRENKESED